jgi:hypothetical protein
MKTILEKINFYFLMKTILLKNKRVLFNENYFRED